METTDSAVVVLAFILTGAGALVAAVGWTVHRFHACRGWRRERALAVGRVSVPSRNGRTVRALMMERVDEKGRVHRRCTDYATSRVPWSGFPYPIDVVVNPADGGDFRRPPDDFDELFPSLVVGGLGIVFVVVAVSIWALGPA